MQLVERSLFKEYNLVWQINAVKNFYKELLKASCLWENFNYIIENNI